MLLTPNSEYIFFSNSLHLVSGKLTILQFYHWKPLAKGGWDTPHVLLSEQLRL